MKKLQRQFVSLFFIASILLAGCGGGSSGSPTASSKAATSSAASSVASSGSSSSISSAAVSLSSSITSSSAPAITSLIMKGSVVADALHGGEVIVALGAQTFRAAINDQGRYELRLDVANTDINKPFSALATGATANQWAQLAALYPSISKLVTLAGADGILNATEYLGVNISPMTTAEYALVLSQKLSIATDIERKYALLQIDADAELKRAAFVKRLLSDENVDLLGKYKTLLEMLLDFEYTRGQVNIMHSRTNGFNQDYAELQSDPLQTHISNQPIAGKFVIGNDQIVYLLDINANGTGRLRTPNSFSSQIWTEDGSFREAGFSWVRTLNDIKITFDSPIDFGRNYHYSDLYGQDCVSAPETPYLPGCSIEINSMLVSLFSENEVGKVADIKFNASLISNSKADASALEVVVEINSVKLLDTTQFYKFSKEELFGYDWYSSRSSYLFKVNGTATQVNQITQNQYSIDWKLEEGALLLNSDGSFLLPMYPAGPGFVALEFFNNSSNSGERLFLQKTMLLKYENISMTESDWVGRWNRISNNSFYSAVDYYANHVFRDGFETQALGSWSVISDTHVRGFSNGSWRMDHELIAVHDGLHYMQYCYRIDYQASPMDCMLEAHKIDKTFSGTTFWAIWSNPLFQEVDSLDAWKFSGNRLERDGMPVFNYQPVAANLLYESEYGKVLELISSTLDTIKVCEYDAFSSCESGTLYNLRRSIEIKVEITGYGAVGGYNNTRSFMIRRGQDYLLSLTPGSGYQITANNISGCEGVLGVGAYTISARDTDCELKVNFTQIP